MSLSKKIAFVGKNCVSCGSCLSVCPKNAISIYCGITAVVDIENCVGCGKCEKICPAGVIVIGLRPQEENV